MANKRNSGTRSSKARTDRRSAGRRSPTTEASGDGDERDLNDRFRAVADHVTQVTGTPWSMLAAVLVIVAWLVTGPAFGFSDTWQLIINTGTTIVTFLMVFAIQTSQNRDSKAVQLKLDELIKATHGARNRLIDEERQSEKSIERDLKALRRQAHTERGKR